MDHYSCFFWLKMKDLVLINASKLSLSNTARSMCLTNMGSSAGKGYSQITSVTLLLLLN